MVSGTSEAEEKTLTPIDALIKFGGCGNEAEAALKLCELLALDPATLGWRAPSNLPVICLIPGELPRIINEAEAALVASQGAGSATAMPSARLVRIAWEPIRTTAGEASVLRLCEVKPAHLLERFEASARFEKLNKWSNEFVQAACPEQIAEAYLARDGDWDFPPLLGVVTAPTRCGPTAPSSTAQATMRRPVLYSIRAASSSRRYRWSRRRPTRPKHWSS